MRTTRLDPTLLDASTRQATGQLPSLRHIWISPGMVLAKRIFFGSFSILLALAAIALIGMLIWLRGNAFVQTILVASNTSYHPQIVDPLMRDAWGIALRPPGAGGHIWIDNAESGTSSEYIGDVNGEPIHQDGLKNVPLAMPRFTDHGYAFVTGLAYSSAHDIKDQPVEFPVAGPANNNTTSPPTPIPGGASGSSAFVFVTEDGCINAWRSNTKEAMVDAPVMIDYSKTAAWMPYHANCVFSGCALTNNAFNSDAFAKLGGNHLFATDFRNGKIEVFNNTWHDVTTSFHFQTPADVGDLHPFNIMDIGGHLYVAYAMFEPAGDEGMEERDGPGYGHLVEYNEDGSLVRDFKDEGMLNAPWGIAIAPDGFGKFGGDVLVANLGDNTIAALDSTTGEFVDQLKDEWGNVINIDRIWGLAFGNGVSLGDVHSLYFTAGPKLEYEGIFGKFTVAPMWHRLLAGLVVILLALASWWLWKLQKSITVPKPA